MRTGYVLGISCGYHDSAASLIRHGDVLGACEEERFTGIKHDYSFPTNTINWLFEKYNVTKDDLDYIAFYENPILKLERIEETTKRGGWLNYFKRKKIISNNKKHYSTLLEELNNIKGKNTEIVFGDHHLSHLAYSYYTSPFKESAILSVDGVGEWETTSIAYGTEEIQKLKSINFPHSLGMLYSTLTAFLGFKPNEGEYKVMGLAPYGKPITYNKKFLELYTLSKNGSFELNMEYFTYDYTDTHMFNEKLGKLFGIPNRIPGEELTQDHKDLAASLQSNYEKIFFTILNNLQKETGSENLCLGGGCAYNGTANGKILKRTKFKNLYIPPAPSDAGSAIGCALNISYNKYKDIPRKENTNPFLGPFYNKDDYFQALQKFDLEIYYEKKLYEQIIDKVALEITEGNVIGWFQGRMEFGARALGNRSILANPKDPQMKARLNKVIKKREGFRPFAPIVKEELASKFFNYYDKVPYMNQVVGVRKQYQKDLPAITHIDSSARIQTLNKLQNKHIYDLLSKLEEKNGFPIVINTSFNLKDQTMVLTPQDAIQTFLNCEMDTLILGNYIVKKKIL